MFSANAQVDKSSKLFKNLKEQDSIFFEKGFNNCDLDYLNNHIANDLKFYHDQSGLQDKKTFFENIQNYICSHSQLKPIRKLDLKSLEVFPLYKNGKLYGAIQKGVHHFYLRERNHEDKWTSTAKFTHVWTKENEIWKLSEVLSYDHQNSIKDEPKSHLENLLEQNNVPALGMATINNGKLTKVEVIGTLDKQKTAPYNTIFKVASLTKPIVALTILKLVDKGLLDLDEPLHHYWIDPDLEQDKRYKNLTPKIILSHQTGFPNWRHLSDNNQLAFEFEPGTKFQYSGEGFEYLRKAIENKLDKPIEELAADLLFDPLGMTDTHFWWDSTMDATRYAQNFDDQGETIKPVKYYKANAAANLLTTVEDYGRFLEYIINGAGLSDHLFKAMTKQHVKLKSQDFFGLGWEILTGFTNDEIALLHTGKDPGVSTLAVWFPNSKNGYIIFMNGDRVDNIYEDVLTNRFYMGQELWNRR
jgi:CubicO group peptidase (beta-lactamase class C family)